MPGEPAGLVATVLGCVLLVLLGRGRGCDDHSTGRVQGFLMVTLFVNLVAVFVEHRSARGDRSHRPIVMLGLTFCGEAHLVRRHHGSDHADRADGAPTLGVAVVVISTVLVVHVTVLAQNMPHAAAAVFVVVFLTVVLSYHFVRCRGVGLREADEAVLLAQQAELVVITGRNHIPTGPHPQRHNQVVEEEKEHQHGHTEEITQLTHENDGRGAQREEGQTAGQKGQEIATSDGAENVHQTHRTGVFASFHRVVPGRAIEMHPAGANGEQHEQRSGVEGGQEGIVVMIQQGRGVDHGQRNAEHRG
mmetsp:Transcript_12911/g.22655  ORF Transcript_12911/g.22655 Transcript_12911/m.22655 type:complete len:304 (-) Transcript_12911:220-1131(-)